MKANSKSFLALISAVLTLVLVMSSDAARADETKSEHAMTMHHMHVMVNHGIEMAAEGANLVMLGQMDMAKGVDDTSISHGKMMIEQGKKMIEQMMSGPAMKRLHAEGSGKDDPQMAYTHELGDAALAYITVLEKMSAAPAHKH